MDNEILSLIGKIVAYGGGGAVIFYSILRYFGRKWLDEKFSKRLEEFKRFQNQEFEKYRFEINKLFNRVTKIHDEEFEILPTLWEKLQNAFSVFITLSSPFQSWPDLNKFSSKELASFLEACELLEFQKKEILDIEDKLKYFQDKTYWIRLNNARKTFFEFRTYLQYNKIFLNKELFELFSEIEFKLLETETILEHIIGEKHWKDHYEAFKKLKEDGSKVIKKIETEIQSRLHFIDS